MGKKRAGPSAAIAPAAGKKMTFGDDDDFDYAAPSSPGIPSDVPSDDEEEQSGSDSDSDAAPEAVGMRAGAADERKRAAAEEEERKAKREAAKLRAARVAEAKAKKPSKEKRKRSDPESEDSEDKDDSEAARLRRRMDAAMVAGEGDSQMEEEEEESDFDEDGDDDFDALEDEDEDAEEDEEEEEDEAEEEEDEEESDEEGLFSRPVSSALKSKMDAMMAAMEGRAMAADPKFADEMASRRKKGPVLEVPALKSKKAKSQSVGTKTTFDDFGELDAAPLSADMLAAADAQLATEKSQEKTKGEERAKKRRRKGGKGKQAPTVRVLDDRAVHLLPPVLAGTALPPVVGPRERVVAANKAKQTFYKRAMKASGKIPGKGVVDGRRR
ncbi:hypothetical protein CC85DRAFT_287349 [Cutaneotrichosporon oleaginosum]|uniref:Uncharacterized protein n=1 Tax=Cutaneotrichosporon oleaginosum TaxID=879819 RepID=A0A0J1AYV5_9TREE|nr:uncharacterized protein CC85DRAFT_287349 [Cutaneotrichosporon oleaginosum]KLT40504.1 hypothetical protein CC85DRAFT_287349 [Cutaneotrichosporon oleaginosum]TXT08424.1 hypothetical protein COLE_05348 [Cutaneotrichosporon oleaginosum]